ncbi:MAG: TonB-dependent receptor, partial [Pedobacter sp.]
VYTTPPAKYDAEGLGGIINIITNKKLVDGYNGTLNLNNRYPGGPGLGTSFTVKQGKLGISGYGGASTYSNPETTLQNMRNTTGSNPTILDQHGVTGSDGKTGYFGADLSYEIDSLNLISGQLNMNGSSANSYTNLTSLLNGPKGSVGYDFLSATNSKSRGMDMALNYQMGFRNDKSKLFTFSYQHNHYTKDADIDLATINRADYNAPDYNQINKTSAAEHTVQADYVQTLKKWSVELGAKAIFRDNGSAFQYNSFDVTTGTFKPDPTLSNNYNSKQHIFAAYNSWQLNTKNVNVKAGLRVEQTVTDADFMSTASAVHQTYFNAIPSLAINWQLAGNSSINVGFSQRLKRPGINRLNPFIDRSNPNFQTAGNPNLTRVVVSDISAGYSISKKAKLNFSIFYDFGDNLDLLVSTYDSPTNTTFSTYKNVGKVTGLGNSINFSYPVTNNWNLSTNSTVMYFTLSGEADGVQRDINFFTVGIYLSTNYSFDHGWRLGGNLNINGRNPSGLQGSSNGQISTGLNMNKQLIKNKLSFSAAVSNPFTKYRHNITELSGNNFTQTTNNQTYFRSFTASLNYNFGKLKESVKKTKRGIRNDDN